MKEGVGRALRRAIGRDDVLSRIKPRKGGVSVLMNEKRRLIFQHLMERPLTHLRELSRETGIPVGTADWHLKALMEANVVSVYQGRRRSHFYPSGWIDDSDLPCLSLLQGQTPKALYKLVQKNPGLSQTEIADKMKKYQQFVQPHIIGLERCGLLRSERKGRKKVHLVTEKLAELEQKYETRSPDYMENALEMLEKDGLNPKIRGRSKDAVRVRIDDGRNTFPIRIGANPISAIMKQR
ncbi:MAG: winged helix-turn-helix transcriptional regulator [Methanomassiliicoccales archaeon]|nr:MAG: winged helix-turn-helix transcriptional regulator [Methanomassiliicoccales archaeon]